MRIATAAAAGALITLAIVAITRPEPTVVYQTEVHERIIIEEVLTTIDLEELKAQIADLDERLYTECLEIVIRHTGDPRAGVIRHIERHYQGDACRAADEALRGEW
jgi:hypothetical protein